MKWKKQTASQLEVHQDCQQQVVEIFTTKITNPIENILVSSQKNMDFKVHFAGMQYPFSTREEHWGYVATFLNTTQTATVRKPYLDLDRLLRGKEFFILTANQDTQFTKLYPEEKISEIQGDHRFFQCANCCTDDTWDAVKPVKEMIRKMGEGILCYTLNL